MPAAALPVQGRVGLDGATSLNHLIPLWGQNLSVTMGTVSEAPPEFASSAVFFIRRLCVCVCVCVCFYVFSSGATLLDVVTATSKS